MKTCYCGEPVPKGRRKYCSQQCFYRHHNLRYDRVLRGDYDNRQPPPDYEGVWLTPPELRERNRELAKYGRRICTTHQGGALPLTEEFFRCANKGKGYFRYQCRDCHNRTESASQRIRYATRPELRERHAARQVTRYQKQKRERLAQILGGAS